MCRCHDGSGRDSVGNDGELDTDPVPASSVAWLSVGLRSHFSASVYCNAGGRTIFDGAPFELLARALGAQR